jgi:hypothetical protein
MFLGCVAASTGREIIGVVIGETTIRDHVSSSSAAGSSSKRQRTF